MRPGRSKTGCWRRSRSSWWRSKSWSSERRRAFWRAAVVFPLVYLIPATSVSIHVANWPLLIVVVLLASLTSGALGLALGTIVRPAQIGLMFALVVVPITFLGCVYYPWAMLHPVRWLQILVMVNPLVYMSEGLRAALTPDLPHMPVWGFLGALDRRNPDPGYRRSPRLRAADDRLTKAVPGGRLNVAGRNGPQLRRSASFHTVEAVAFRGRPVTFHFWTQPVSPRATVLAGLASAAVHAFVVTAVVPTGLQPAKEDLDRLLPALYLIAPNRQPQAPREMQLVAVPLGDLPFRSPRNSWRTTGQGFFRGGLSSRECCQMGCPRWRSTRYSAFSTWTHR